MRIFTFIAFAFFASKATAQSQELIDAATAYVDSPVQQELMEDMLSPEGIMAQMGLFGGSMPQEKMDALAQIVSEELDTIKPALRQASINGMASNFSLEEIEALNAFYSSEHGASAMKKMNPFMQQTMAAMAPDFARMQGNLARRIEEELSE